MEFMPAERTSICGFTWSIPTGSDVDGVPWSPDAGDDELPWYVTDIMTRRGIPSAHDFFRPSLRAVMPDPELALSGMTEAVKIFVSAVMKGKKVAILGDYDVDGATSTAMLLRWLRLVGRKDAIFHIPHRMNEGYGPSIFAVNKLHGEGASLLVIVDSGTLSFEPIKRARELGMDVVVIDHHEPGENGSLPDATVINPKLPTNDGSLSHLCSAGLVFMFLVAVNRLARQMKWFNSKRKEPTLSSLLGLVALGTVADIVPLKSLNRAYAQLGFPHMADIPGLAALRDILSKRSQNKDSEIQWNAYSCGFLFGPCINAAGRISDTRLGTILLSEDNYDKAAEIAETLVKLNAERQDIQRVMIEECENMVDDPGPSDDVIVLHNQSWHPGVIGICASKIKDRFNRSTVIIGENGKGSARSVNGFNMGKALLRAKESGLLIAGGGHAAAGGLTINPARLDEFIAFMRSESKGMKRPPIEIDLVLRIGELTTDMIHAFESFQPFGMGNPKPRIAITGGRIDRIQILKGKHIKARLVEGRDSVEVIAFNSVGTTLGDGLVVCEGQMVDLLAELAINSYGGAEKIQLKPVDAMIAFDLEA